jgi:hypothetical protein
MAKALPYTYPISKQEAQEILDIQTEENFTLERDLEVIRTRCREQCQSDTTKCPEHSTDIRRLWRTYYTSTRPGSWVSYRPEEYIAELRQMFDTGVPIKKIHERVKLEQRRHSRDALCTTRFNDDPLVKHYKTDAFQKFDSGLPEQEIRDFISQKQAEVASKRTPRQREYDEKLAACANEEEKLQLYKQDILAPSPSDTPAMIKLRQKWSSLFESGRPYPEIHAQIAKDLEYHEQRERELRQEHASLQLAKAAHDKGLFAKAEKKRARESDAQRRMLEEHTHRCGGRECENLAVPESQEAGVLECGVCFGLREKGLVKEGSYFCGEECLVSGMLSLNVAIWLLTWLQMGHMRAEHECAALHACPRRGRERMGTDESYGGICNHCWTHFRLITYFCSPECFERSHV